MILSGSNLGDRYHQKPSSPAELLIPSLYLVFTLYVIYISLVAWIGDDAFITFRTIDNFINGYGLRWNVDERVQSFTHPLWLLILICGTIFTSNIFYLALIISLLISTATFAIILFNKRIALPVRLVLGCVLLLSKCYVDYSTSGLENPLTHLLLTLFFLLAFAEERSSRMSRQIDRFFISS